MSAILQSHSILRFLPQLSWFNTFTYQATLRLVSRLSGALLPVQHRSASSWKLQGSANLLFQRMRQLREGKDLLSWVTEQTSRSPVSLWQDSPLPGSPSPQELHQLFLNTQQPRTHRCSSAAPSWPEVQQHHAGFSCLLPFCSQATYVPRTGTLWASLSQFHSSATPTAVVPRPGCRLSLFSNALYPLPLLSSPNPVPSPWAFFHQDFQGKM